MLRVISQLFVIICKVQKHQALFLLGHLPCNVSELFSPKPMVLGYRGIVFHLSRPICERAQSAHAQGTTVQESPADMTGNA